MNDSHHTTPTISTPFIYLKLKAIKGSIPRKITYPTSIDQLLATAARIFKDSIVVRSLLNEDGNQVETLNDVIPGSTLLCSELAPFITTPIESPTMSTPKRKCFDVMSKTSFTRIFGTDIGDSPAQVIFNPVDTTKGKPVDIKDRVSKGCNLSPREKVTAEVETSIKAAKQAKKRENRIASLKKRLSLTPQSKAPEPIQEAKTPSPGKYGDFLSTGKLPPSLESPKKEIYLKSSENETPNANKHIEEVVVVVEQKKAQTEEEIEEVNNSTVYNLFSSLLSENYFESESKEAMMYLDKPARTLISHLPDLEEAQKARWHSKCIKMIQDFDLPPVDDSLLGYDSMIGIARCIIMDHRFHKKGGYLHRFNIAITGPKRSGKSTFLSIFIQELLLELIATDKYKEFFIFVLDMQKIVDNSSNFQDLYFFMVNATFKQIEHQSPQNSQHIPMLIKYFNSIVTLENPPRFPKLFREYEPTRVLAIKLQQIADQLSDAWNNDSAFNQFITNVMMFPKMISDIFGFRKQLVIFDNFELCDLFILPKEPFSKETESFQFASLMTFILTNHDFIISCKDQVFLSNLLLCVEGIPPIPEYISTLNISADKAFSKYQFNCSVHGEIVPFTVEHCGGIPSYVYSWISLNEFYEQSAKIQGKKEKEESELILLEKVENIMRLLFAYDNDDSFSIDSVTRTKCV